MLLQTSLNTAPVFTAAVKQRVLACNGPPSLTLVVRAVTCFSLRRLSGGRFVEGWVRGLMSFVHQNLFFGLFMADKYRQNTKIQKSMEALLFFLLLKMLPLKSFYNRIFQLNLLKYEKVASSSRELVEFLVIF